MANIEVIEETNHEENMNEILNKSIERLCGNSDVDPIEHSLMLCRFLKLLAMAVLYLIWKVQYLLEEEKRGQ